MIELTPKKFRISSGYGISKYGLLSFDYALANAGISDYNIVKVSSILPPCCLESPILDLKKGSILLTAYGTITSENQGNVISSAVCVAIPQSSDDIGVIMETAGLWSADNSKRIVKEMAELAMQSRNIPIKNIFCSSIDYVVHANECATVISAVSMW